MLYIARRAGEAVIIADVIRMEVMETTGLASCLVKLSGPPDLVPVPQIVRVNLQESFRIADEVVVTVRQIRSSGIVRFGFDADRAIPINREEVQIRAQMS